MLSEIPRFPRLSKQKSKELDQHTEYLTCCYSFLSSFPSSFPSSFKFPSSFPSSSSSSSSFEPRAFDVVVASFTEKNGSTCSPSVWQNGKWFVNLDPIGQRRPLAPPSCTRVRDHAPHPIASSYRTDRFTDCRCTQPVPVSRGRAPTTTNRSVAAAVESARSRRQLLAARPSSVSRAPIGPGILTCACAYAYAYTHGSLGTDSRRVDRCAW